jgi:hypothetical protein
MSLLHTYTNKPKGEIMKKVLTGAAVVFVILEVLDILIHGVILGSVYATLQYTWRSDMMQKMWILHIVKVVVAFMFAFIFSKGYEGKGLMEGVRYGFYVGLMLSMGFAFGSYASFRIPYQLALQWFVYAMIEYVIAGIGVALVFGKKK